MKSTIAKVAVTGGIALATIGIGAGVASADPVHDQQQSSQVQDQQMRDQQMRDQQQQPQAAQPSAHGFWIFGFWIPLPY